MNAEFIEYLNDLNITGILQNRIEDIYKIFKEMCPDEIVDIFVTNYIKENGSKEYENIWFFSDKYAMEGKNFITKDDFDITPIKNRIHYWNIKLENYDYQSATQISRLFLKFISVSGINFELKASAENCDYLRDIIKKYVKANLMELD